MSGWSKVTERGSRASRIADDWVDAVTIALTWLVLLILCGPFEIAAWVAKAVRSTRRAAYRRQLGRHR
jgi:hypothetical protein